MRNKFHQIFYGEVDLNSGMFVQYFGRSVQGRIVTFKPKFAKKVEKRGF
jgi:predicted aconitase with swiveling domain